MAQERASIAAFWSGTMASLILVTNPIINFAVYEFLKKQLYNIAKIKNSAIFFFIIGAISKLIATYMTYPLQVAQTRMRKGNAKSDQRGGARTLIGRITEA